MELTLVQSWAMLSIKFWEINHARKESEALVASLIGRTVSCAGIPTSSKRHRPRVHFDATKLKDPTYGHRSTNSLIISRQRLTPFVVYHTAGTSNSNENGTLMRPTYIFITRSGGKQCLRRGLQFQKDRSLSKKR